MADHSMGAALYGLQAVKLAGGSIGEERTWQLRRLADLLPAPVVVSVTNAMASKEKHMRILRA